MGKTCPVLCAHSSGSHPWMLEGRLYHPCENQHPVLLEILKPLCSASVGIILSWHMGCSRQWDTPAAGGEQAAPSKGTTNHLSTGTGRMCCSRGACSGLIHWEWCCTLPTSSKASGPVVPWVQQAQGKHSVKRFAVLYCEIDLRTTQKTTVSLFVPCKSQQAGQPCALGVGRSHGRSSALADHGLCLQHQRS